LEDAVPYLDDISSLVNGRVVRAEGDTLIVEDLMKQPPETVEALRRVHALIERQPLYENLLVSRDRSIVSILIRAEAVIESEEEEVLTGFEEGEPSETASAPNYLSNEENVEIYDAIHQITAKYQGRGIEFYYAGTPAFVAEMQKGIEKDLGLMTPLSFLMVTLFLLILFRRVSGVVYPLLTVVLSLLSTLGIMAMIHIPFTNVSAILPMFLIVVGIGDSVHILTIFFRNYREIGDKRQALIQAVSRAGLPVLMTSVTTACGLLSFSAADVATVAHLGTVGPAGVMLAFFYTVVLLPALIAIFPMKRGKPVPKGKRPLVDRTFAAISRVTTRRPVMVTVISAIIVAAAGYSALSVRFSHNALTWFPEDSSIRMSTELLNKVNGGTVMLEVTVEAGEENALYDPDLVRRLDEAAAYISGLNVHGIQASKAWSIADVLKEINRALHEDKEEAYRTPDTRKMIAQQLVLFESSGSDDLEDVADSPLQTGRLSILAPFTDSVLYKDYIEKVGEYLAERFPDEKVTLTGHIALFMRITKNFITSMAKSYVFALLVITFLMVLMIGRLRVGLMSMFVNVAPIIVIFGVMGLHGIPLDMATILLGSIVLGLVVDDTIHFFHHFRASYEATSDVEIAVRETLLSTGRALAITSMVLCGGFFIFMTSYLSCYQRFGLLVGCAVILALAADFFLAPALLTLAHRKKPARAKIETANAAPAAALDN
ncbi:MAG: MMPL family transporter, partial [Desulfobacterales bacterium]|nr:MMPL family transporter [Desulfobacterales bacterium]